MLSKKVLRLSDLLQGWVIVFRLNFYNQYSRSLILNTCNMPLWPSFAFTSLGACARRTLAAYTSFYQFVCLWMPHITELAQGVPALDAPKTLACNLPFAPWVSLPGMHPGHLAILVILPVTQNAFALNLKLILPEFSYPGNSLDTRLPLILII